MQEDGTLLEFNLEDAILPGVEITMAEIEAEVFEPENNFEPQPQHHTVFDPQPQPGPSSGLPSDGVRPRQHNMYGSGDLSDMLVDDFGRPIERIVTRSYSQSSSTSQTTVEPQAPTTMNADRIVCNVCKKSYKKSYISKHKCCP